MRIQFLTIFLIFTGVLTAQEDSLMERELFRSLLMPPSGIPLEQQQRGDNAQDRGEQLPLKVEQVLQPLTEKPAHKEKKKNRKPARAVGQKTAQMKSEKIVSRAIEIAPQPVIPEVSPAIKPQPAEVSKPPISLKAAASTGRPSYYRGIYLNNGTARNARKFNDLLTKSKLHSINALVLDVQPRMPARDFLELARSQGMYLIARIVVFEGGLNASSLPETHMRKIFQKMESSAEAGFQEIQLDYIRFADRSGHLGLGLQKRYAILEEILKKARAISSRYGVRLGADIFGRIAFNKNDIIGQNLELFSAHLDTIYPMLYPSHFYGQPAYIENPYRTIKEGVENCRKRKAPATVAYIQGFKMKIPSRMSYTDYIVRQLEASRDARGDGFIVWNPGNNYAAFFGALKRFDAGQ
jgi:hypothetical protein